MIVAIVNPAAGRGSAGKRLDRVRAALAAHGIDRIEATREAGDEERLAASAIEGGATRIVAIGGDGTCGRIANSLVSSGSECSLALIPAGTGNDFAKTLGVHNRPLSEAVEIAALATPIRIDVGRADGRYFLNSCGFGFDAAVLEATSGIGWLKGDAVYIYSALRMLFGYRGFSVLESGKPTNSRPAEPSAGRRHLLMLTASNGRFLGGAFMIAPNASARDGLLDIACVRDASVPRRLELFARAMRGTHPGLAAVTIRQLAQITLRFDFPPAIEIDGELHRSTNAEINLECLPQALRVAAAPGAMAG